MGTTEAEILFFSMGRDVSYVLTELLGTLLAILCALLLLWHGIYLTIRWITGGGTMQIDWDEENKREVKQDNDIWT